MQRKQSPLLIFKCCFPGRSITFSNATFIAFAKEYKFPEKYRVYVYRAFNACQRKFRSTKCVLTKYQVEVFHAIYIAGCEEYLLRKVRSNSLEDPSSLSAIYRRFESALLTSFQHTLSCQGRHETRTEETYFKASTCCRAVKFLLLFLSR